MDKCIHRCISPLPRLKIRGDVLGADGPVPCSAASEGDDRGDAQHHPGLQEPDGRLPLHRQERGATSHQQADLRLRQL